MALTRDFKETIRARAARDPRFRKELLREGLVCTLAADTATATTIFHDYVPDAHRRQRFFARP